MMHSAHETPSNNYTETKTYLEFRRDSWANQTLSKGSIAFGDYDERASDSSVSIMIDSSYSSLQTQSSRYQGLRTLIDSWLHDTSDHDQRLWPEIETILKNSKIKFREPFD